MYKESNIFMSFAFNHATAMSVMLSASVKCPPYKFVQSKNETGNYQNTTRIPCFNL